MINKLTRLFATSTVTAVNDTAMLEEKDRSKYDVLIIDLKDCALPNTTIGLPIMALTGVPSFPEALRLLQQKTTGYGNRQMRSDNLRQALETVKAGQIWLPPTIISKLITAAGTGDKNKNLQVEDTILDSLSTREQEVAQYVAKGMSNQEMADQMFISLRTVKAHLSSIYDKTGIRNRLELGLRLK